VANKNVKGAADGEISSRADGGSRYLAGPPSRRDINRGGAERAANIIEAMKRRSPTILLALFGVALAALLPGCGGGTKTVDASTPLPEATTSTNAPRTSATTTIATTTSSTPTSTAPPSENGGTAGPSTTRTATAPAFTHREGTATTTTGESAEGLSAAEAVVQAKGFTVAATSDYHPDQTLRVLVGTRTGSAEGNGQQAFFFVDGRYIGTDAKQPSAQVNVVSQGDTEVALAYTLAGGGQATVRFQLNNGKLVPLGQIPSAGARQ
jgi:LppP/LprE lipoprotein